MTIKSKDPKDYHFFWKQTKLSQWVKSPFTIEEIDLTFQNAEQFMMYGKAVWFKDKEIYNKIMQTSNPKEVKQLGRMVKNFNQIEWDKKKYDIVKQGNQFKFEQNEDCRNELLSTGNKILVEASPYDRIWGIGYSAEHPYCKNVNVDYWGENLLGKLLMELREELRKDCKQ